MYGVAQNRPCEVGLKLVFFKAVLPNSNQLPKTYEWARERFTVEEYTFCFVFRKHRCAEL